MSQTNFEKFSCNPSDKRCQVKCIDPAAIQLRNNWNHIMVLYLDLYVSICIGTTIDKKPCKTPNQISTAFQDTALAFMVAFPNT